MLKKGGLKEQLNLLQYTSNCVFVERWIKNIGTTLMTVLLKGTRWRGNKIGSLSLTNVSFSLINIHWNLWLICFWELQRYWNKWFLQLSTLQAELVDKWTEAWGKKTVGLNYKEEDRTWGFILPSEMFLPEVGQYWRKNEVHAIPTVTLSLTSTSAKRIANLTGVNCLLISQSVWLITLVSSLASSRSALLSSNLRAMVFSFASMSWSLELKSSFTSLVCCTSLSLAWTWSRWKEKN